VRTAALSSKRDLWKAEDPAITGIDAGAGTGAGAGGGARPQLRRREEGDLDWRDMLPRITVEKRAEDAGDALT